ncbi:ABC transporter ATP-binding protein [Desulforhabdus amnigena]|jgi:NitT/TauT family transport system ATP-binding protein|uniref:Nitrate ABC transporter ATP-binding protein n=1 Tax=Desulforhabdus amnigena TaxID=40218 RepID=A0A9W6CV45_9BACT|nr:ABC transporter ATP-binding protein [Desulforhabdus amnigena]NLJ29654.1 ABC transporter ATP-binding protein [Deltaproteobacteria bacterium]GLI33074.1 nitrate ABC transporter ATP-binding protein [Desulforhabdus amnigena]
MSTEIAFELRQVRKVFPGRGGRRDAVVALDRLDLVVGVGEFVAVVGPSGCGKTTLIDLIAGFTRPTEGSITAGGQPVRSPGPDRVVVFQDHAVFPWYTALENVAYGLRRQGMGRDRARQCAREALNRMGLGKFVHAYPGTLSGGMRQRVALARALVLKPDILLLDEPFAALDAVTRVRLQDELVMLWQDCGWTVLFVTHNLAEAIYLADRVVVLDRPPTGLRKIKPIVLPRPRRRSDARLGEHAEHLKVLMGGCFDNADSEESVSAQHDNLG